MPREDEEVCEGSSRGGTYIGKAFHSVFWLSNYLTVGYSDGTRPTERFSAQESLALLISQKSQKWLYIPGVAKGFQNLSK